MIKLNLRKLFSKKEVKESDILRIKLPKKAILVFPSTVSLQELEIMKDYFKKFGKRKEGYAFTNRPVQIIDCTKMKKT